MVLQQLSSANGALYATDGHAIYILQVDLKGTAYWQVLSSEFGGGGIFERALKEVLLANGEKV